MNLDIFLSSNLRNVWIEEPYIRVYVRKAVHIIGVAEMVHCLDIGSVEVDEDKQGQGIFTAFLKRFEKESKKLNRVVYVESILNPRLYDYLLDNGYALVPLSSDISPCVFKKPLDIPD